MSLVLAILALGILIVVHEAGHYYVARWSKMRVERFSVGFGPALLKWRRKETQFQIAAVPFGGFVQITGMNPHEEFDPKDPHVYPNRPTWQRFLTIFAGPATNYLFAIVLIFAVLAAAGLERRIYHEVNEVQAGEPAEGILQPGDRLLAVDGEPVFYERGVNETMFVSRIQAAEGRPVRVTVLRQGAEIDVEIAPAAHSEGNTTEYRVGVRLMAHTERDQVGIGAAAGHALAYPFTKSRDILHDLYKIATRKEKGDVMGPVGITHAIQQHIRAGWVRAFEVLALLNVYLGLFNLLPLPALDGGRLAFLGYELATRRRPNPRIEAVVHTAGFLVLFALMILVVFRDIKRLVT
jgi:regulator of sigma E protease